MDGQRSALLSRYRLHARRLERSSRRKPLEHRIRHDRTIHFEATHSVRGGDARNCDARGGLLAAMIGPACHSVSAQDARAVSGCYRFDRAYFSWVGRRPAARAVVQDSTAIVRLSDTTALRHVLVSGRVLDLEPLPFVADSSTRRAWLGPSHWRLDAGVADVVWRNGLYGPVFRLSVHDDTLRGTVRFTTDVAGAEPTPQPAWAVRIPCPQASR